MLIIGIDEAGYGSIAGPLVVAAVAYEKHDEPPSITTSRGRKILVQDSKKIKAENMGALATAVEKTAYTHGVHVIPAVEVDALGGPYSAKLMGLTLIAHRIVERLHILQGSVRKATVIVDGHVDLQLPFPYDAIPKADETIWQVSAASILAKHTQLLQMLMAHSSYSRYDFKTNKGYPTKDHIERLNKYGPCRIHRRSTRSLEPWRKKPKGRE